MTPPPLPAAAGSPQAKPDFKVYGAQKSAADDMFEMMSKTLEKQGRSLDSVRGHRPNYRAPDHHFTCARAPSVCGQFRRFYFYIMVPDRETLRNQTVSRVNAMVEHMRKVLADETIGDGTFGGDDKAAMRRFVEGVVAKELVFKVSCSNIIHPMRRSRG